MIEVQALTKTYGQVIALDNLSFQVKKGEIIGFLGANGAGKTTTMDIMCGCIGADAGYVKIGGYDITESPIAAKRQIGYLPDIPPLHPEMIVKDYIQYCAKLHGVTGNVLAKRVDSVIEKLSLGEVRRRLVGNLSKGYRQRVALSQAIVHEPPVLVLDEPTEGLDPNQIAQIRELIKSLAGEHTIILSSHILSEVENTCQKIIIIHKGKIERQGTYRELVKTLQGGDSYLLKVRRYSDDLLTLLGSLPVVQHAEKFAANESTVEITLATKIEESALDDVCLKIIEKGFGIQELSHRKHSLEEIFMQITN